jgi:hypothetical protein
MKDKRFVVGGIASVVWIVVGAALLLFVGVPEEANTWGDFLAGFFAPLAFLWLVLGYMQQGEELKHSTDALKQQALELKQSVEHQGKLVEVTRLQVEQEHQALQEQRERLRDAARPRFVPHQQGHQSGANGFYYKTTLANVGNTATNVLIRFNPPLADPSKGRLVPQMIRNDLLDLNVRFEDDKPRHTVVSITYVDSDGQAGEVRYTMEEGHKQSRLVFGPVERVL